MRLMPITTSMCTRHELNTRRSKSKFKAGVKTDKRYAATKPKMNDYYRWLCSLPKPPADRLVVKAVIRGWQNLDKGCFCPPGYGTITPVSIGSRFEAPVSISQNNPPLTDFGSRATKGQLGFSYLSAASHFFQTASMRGCIVRFHQPLNDQICPGHPLRSSHRHRRRLGMDPDSRPRPRCRNHFY
jgi:hypothetical protein